MNTVDKSVKGKAPAPSRKSKVKLAFSEHGQEVAWTLGLNKLKLKPSTLRTWFATWRREGVVKAKVAKPKVTPKAKKVKVKVASKVITEPVSKPVNGGEGNVATS